MLTDSSRSCSGSLWSYHLGTPFYRTISYFLSMSLLVTLYLRQLMCHRNLHRLLTKYSKILKPSKNRIQKLYLVAIVPGRIIGMSRCWVRDRLHLFHWLHCTNIAINTVWPRTPPWISGHWRNVRVRVRIGCLNFKIWVSFFKFLLELWSKAWLSWRIIFMHFYYFMWSRKPSN